MSIVDRCRHFLLPPEKTLGESFVAEVQRGALRGLRLASGAAVVAALAFTPVYRIALPDRFLWLLPSLLGMTLLGVVGVAVSFTALGKNWPRSSSVAVAMLIGTLLVANQLGVGSHSYGHFGGLSLILLVMASLGTLQPLSVLLAAGYFVLLYFLAGIFLDKSVGWPPAGTFIIGVSSLTVSGIIAVWLTSFSHRVRRTEFLLRDELGRAFRDLQDTQAQLLVTEKALSQSQLVSALCHELNNPFAVIQSNLATQEKIGRRIEEAIALSAPDTIAVAKLLRLNQDLNQGCLAACQRIADLLTRLRDFTHLDEADRKYVDINEELLKALEIVNPSLKSTR